MNNLLKSKILGMGFVLVMIAVPFVVMFIGKTLEENKERYYANSEIYYYASDANRARLLQDLYDVKNVIDLNNGCEYKIFENKISVSELIVPVIKNGEHVCQDKVTPTSKDQ